MKLLNRSEEVTFDRLSEATEESGARAFPKVRIADTLPVQGSGISSELFGFSLKSHFDFVVTDSEYQPLFAVEFDGPTHQSSSEQIERDGKKNAICHRFDFPLLRINSRYINVKYRGLDLLSYLVHVWFLSAAFEHAQEQGYVPLDEPFDPNLILCDGKSDRQFPYWLSLEIQLEFQEMYKQGRLQSYFLSHWIGVDKDGNYRCLAWLEAGKGEYLVAQTGMRRQQFPIYVSDVLMQISAFDLRRALDSYFDMPHNFHSLDQVKSELRRYETTYELRACGGSSSSK